MLVYWIRRDRYLGKKTGFVDLSLGTHPMAILHSVEGVVCVLDAARLALHKWCCGFAETILCMLFIQHELDTAVLALGALRPSPSSLFCCSHLSWGFKLTSSFPSCVKQNARFVSSTVTAFSSQVNLSAWSLLCLSSHPFLTWPWVCLSVSTIPFLHKYFILICFVLYIPQTLPLCFLVLVNLVGIVCLLCVES